VTDRNATMTFLIKVIVFIVASAALAWLSRAPLRDLRSHGFYRFFAWEAIIVLVLLNFNYWFREPFSVHQIISWLLLIVCTFLVVHGALLLHRIGKPDSKRDEPGLIGIEKTTELVTEGAYRYIRHPIYASGFYGAWGIFFKDPSWVGGLMALLTTFLFTMTAKTEEAENIRYFGSAYQDYVKQTKMFIPFLF
jgi:protein-S-isoprenylcysteine O-methyltransferase Ste14